MASRSGSGVNVVGYLDHTSGLGERARELVATLRAAGIDVSEWPVAATASPSTGEDRASARGLMSNQRVHDTTIAVVTAAELPGLVEHHRAVLGNVPRLIGYWFWELACVPESQQPAIDLVDEIWAPTHFVRDAYAAATAKPVRLVPLTIPRPAPALTDRAALGLESEFTFLVSFDHLSVMERKNPLGAIDAFGLAFPRGDEPVRLHVKTLNAKLRTASHRRLADRAADDARIRLVDGHVGDGEHLALIRESDALVSLHRSEGLGLQPAAAMWLGTPVIASRYSGTLDLMDDASAALIDVTLVPVRNSDGAYPSEGVWAEPDLDQAANAMRRLVAEPDFAAALAKAARERRDADPDRAAVGAVVAKVLASGVLAVGSVRRMADRPATAAVTVDANTSSVSENAISPRTPKGIARSASAPVRGFFNQHFEMVKDEVRRHGFEPGWARVAQLVHELEATIAETSLHQTRAVVQMRDEMAGLHDRIAELERLVARLADVVAAGTVPAAGTDDERTSR